MASANDKTAASWKGIPIKREIASYSGIEKNRFQGFASMFLGIMNNKA